MGRSPQPGVARGGQTVLLLSPSGPESAGVQQARPGAGNGLRKVSVPRAVAACLHPPATLGHPRQRWPTRSLRDARAWLRRAALTQKGNCALNAMSATLHAKPFLPIRKGRSAARSRQRGKWFCESGRASRFLRGAFHRPRWLRCTRRKRLSIFSVPAARPGRHVTASRETTTPSTAVRHLPAAPGRAGPRLGRQTWLGLQRRAIGAARKPQRPAFKCCKGRNTNRRILNSRP